MKPANFFVSMFSCCLFAGFVQGCATTKTSPRGDTAPSDIVQIANEAYIYGYPLVTMEMTRRVMTNVEKPEGTRAPMGSLVRMRHYPSAAFRDVTAPNADTLYTTAWVDVGQEPWVLSLPDANGRYFLMPMLDGWTDVFQVPGKRTTGTKAQKYAITGPGWKGTLPRGVIEYRSPTSLVWILGRIYCTGTPEDYKAVHALQDQIALFPLSAYGKSFNPPVGKVDPTVDMKSPVRAQVNALKIDAFFNLLNQLMVANPPSPEDAPILSRMAKIGVGAGQTFDLSNFDRSTRGELQKVPTTGFTTIMGHFKEAGRRENGWTYTTTAGVYGTNYTQRAFVTAIGLGANRPQDAVYPTSDADESSQPYSGENKYVIRFEKGQLPPVNGFWSLTMYDDGYFFVDNPLNRYNLSSRNKFITNPDGSVDLYLQHESPGPGKEANWLPAPKGRFIPMARLYWPKQKAPSIIDGSWKLPALKKVS